MLKIVHRLANIDAIKRSSKQQAANNNTRFPPASGRVSNKRRVERVAERASQRVRMPFSHHELNICSYLAFPFL